MAGLRTAGTSATFSTACARLFASIVSPGPPMPAVFVMVTPPLSAGLTTPVTVMTLPRRAPARQPAR